MSIPDLHWFGMKPLSVPMLTVLLVFGSSDDDYKKAQPEAVVQYSFHDQQHITMELNDKW